MLPDIRQNISLFEDSRALPTCLPDVIMEHLCNVTDRGKLKERKTCFIAALSIVNLIWTGPKLNLDPLGVRPETKLLSWHKKLFEL